MSTMHSPITVGLFLAPLDFVAEAIVRGITEYSSRGPAWQIIVPSATEPRWFGPFLKRCDGVIAYCVNSQHANLLRRSHLPVVGYLKHRHMERFPVVLPDEDRIGAMGAEHLLSRGYQRFGFFGSNDPWSEGREGGFVRRLSEAGFACQTTRRGNAPGDRPEWEQLQQPSYLLRWLKRLRPPAAVMGMNDGTAQAIVESCYRLGLRVPEDFAVLGVDNNPLQCNHATIPLSSIDRDLERIGLEAARMLERLMNKRISAAERIVVPPGRLVARRSTSGLAVNDPDVAAAVRFIDEHSARGIDVDDVLAAVPVSRRALETKLLKALGRSPAQEIRRVRLKQVCELLTRTDLPLVDIAARTGYPHRSYLHKAFKKTLGLTPRKYRITSRMTRTYEDEKVGHPSSLRSP
jgi:LacI family transcriptional regulator